jgi:hypothetical protein
VNEAIQDGIGIGGIANQFVPTADRDLAGDQGRALPVTILEDFEQMVAGIGVKVLEPPIIKDEHIDTSKVFHARWETAIAFGKGKLVDQAR